MPHRFNCPFHSHRSVGCVTQCSSGVSAKHVQTPLKQFSVAEHDPQLATLRGSPQVSVPLSALQFLPAALQNAASVCGHWHVCDPVHDRPFVQKPQLAMLRVAPQMSVDWIAPHDAD
ncbi:MAG: hypothetical protein IT381_04670 [Deltaproteobacteria bacterium]|nr:hypothetical protein [Deltaproteobacteria bacterium]